MRRHRPRRCRRHYEKNLRLRKSGKTRKRSVSALVKKMKLNSMKICVLMFYDSGIASFADFTFKINKQYCAKYGFDIIKSNTKKYNDRTPHWERLPLLLAHIRNYDYVMWVDADAFFHHDARSIADIIARYSNYDMIFSKDTCTNTFTGGYDINSGVFIAKNTPKSIQVLEKWAYNPAVFKFAKSRPFWNDQNGIIYIFKNNILNIREHAIILPFGVLQTFERPSVQSRGTVNTALICHLAGTQTVYKNAVCSVYHKKYFSTQP